MRQFILNNLIRKIKKGKNLFLDLHSPYVIYHDPAIALRFFAVKAYNNFSKFFRLFYNSKRVDCNLCGWEGNTFLTFNDYNVKYMRKNSICPACGSMERHRALWKYLNEETQFLKQKIRILHIGPGKSLQRRLISNGAVKYISAGLSSANTALRSDITKLAFFDEQFDLVICFHVLEHVQDDFSALCQLHRILKKDGKGYIQVPMDSSVAQTIEYTYADPKDSHHLRRYGKDFILKLAKSGFQVKIINYDRVQFFEIKKQ
jgi:hypothetical protein